MYHFFYLTSPLSVFNLFSLCTIFQSISLCSTYSLSVQFAQSISLHLFLPNLIPFFSSLFLSSLILYFYLYLSILHPISTHQHHPNFCTNHSISTPTHFSLTLFLSFSLHLSILHLFSVSTFSFKADATRINE